MWTTPEGFDEDSFARACDNALNGIDPGSLSDDEIVAHEAWVAENWEDLNAGGYDEERISYSLAHDRYFDAETARDCNRKYYGRPAWSKY